MSTDTTENRHEWTDEQAARLRAFRESGDLCDIAGSHVHISNNKRGVAAETCARWRRRLREDPTLLALDIDAEWSTSAVREHVYGGCDHDRDEVGEPADSTLRQPPVVAGGGGDA